MNDFYSPTPQGSRPPSMPPTGGSNAVLQNYKWLLLGFLVFLILLALAATVLMGMGDDDDEESGADDVISHDISSQDSSVDGDTVASQINPGAPYVSEPIPDTTPAHTRTTIEEAQQALPGWIYTHEHSGGGSDDVLHTLNFQDVLRVTILENGHSTSDISTVVVSGWLSKIDLPELQSALSLVLGWTDLSSYQATLTQDVQTLVQQQGGKKEYDVPNAHLAIDVVYDGREDLSGGGYFSILVTNHSVVSG